MYHVGEKPTVILYTYINRHAWTTNKTKTKNTMTLDYSSACNTGSRIGWLLWLSGAHVYRTTIERRAAASVKAKTRKRVPGIYMRYETAEPVSRDQILRRKRGQGNIYFSCSADHEQDWQPYPIDPYSCYSICHFSPLTLASNSLALHHVSSCSKLRRFGGVGVGVYHSW